MQSEKKLRVALTLVELLVTITIMGLVIAISLPMVKPMLESNKTKSGADVVAGFLAQARNRAIEEGRPVGVTFERILDYEDRDSSGNVVYPYNGASFLMRQVAEPKPLSGFVKDVRVAVDCSGGTQGQIYFYTWQRVTLGPPEVWEWRSANTEEGYWKKLVFDGDQIQFNAQGPKYVITRTGDVFSIDMRNNLNNPNRNLAPPVYYVNQPALFKVFRKPQATKVAPTMAPPVALPEGIVVDLDSSGMGDVTYDQFGLQTVTTGTYPVVRDMFCANGKSDSKSVTIMFSPTGEVDRVYFSGQNQGANDLVDSRIPNGPIYLNIGIWERAGFWMEDTSKPPTSPERWYISNDYLPDIGAHNIINVRNYHDMNNYWVTIFPRTGAVRVNRVASVSAPAVPEAYPNSRRFANSMHGSDAQ